MRWNATRALRVCLPGMFLLLTLATSSAEDPEIRSRDLPASRLSYPQLLVALGKLRGAFVQHKGASGPEGLREELLFGPVSAPHAEFSSLNEVKLAKLPAVSHEVYYQVRDDGAADVSVVAVSFTPSSHPAVIFQGRDAVALGSVAAAAQQAFEPHSPLLVADPRWLKGGLCAFWLALLLLHALRAKRRRGPASTRRWDVFVRALPLAGFLILQSSDSRLLPSVVAYSADASWWSRHESDALLAGVALAVTCLMLISMYMDARSRTTPVADDHDSPAPA